MCTIASSPRLARWRCDGISRTPRNTIWTDCARDPEASADVRLDVIEGLRRLAQVQASPGSPSVASAEAARRNLERAETLAKELPAEATNRSDRALTLARLALARGRLQATEGEDFEGAHRSLDRASALLTEARQSTAAGSQAAGAKAQSATSLAELANFQTELDAERADTLLWQGKYAQSIEIARAALAQIDAAPVDPGSQRTAKAISAADLRRVRLLDIHAENLYYLEDYPASEKIYREELALVARSRAALPDDLAVTRRFMRAEWALAEALIETGKAAEAERLLADAASIADTLRLFEPQDRDLERTAVVILTAHARSLTALERHREALPLLQRSVAMRLHLWEQSPENWGLARDYAMGLASLADSQAAAKQMPDACRTYEKTFATLDKIRNAGRLSPLDEDHLTRIARERHAEHCPR